MNCQILFSGENKKISSISDLLNLSNKGYTRTLLCCKCRVPSEVMIRNGRQSSHDINRKRRPM